MRFIAKWFSWLHHFLSQVSLTVQSDPYVLFADSCPFLDMFAEMQILRTYALYGKSKKVAALILVVAVLLIGVSVVSYTHFTRYYTEYSVSCSGPSPARQRACQSSKAVTSRLLKHRQFISHLPWHFLVLQYFNSFFWCYSWVPIRCRGVQPLTFNAYTRSSRCLGGTVHVRLHDIPADSLQDIQRTAQIQLDEAFGLGVSYGQRRHVVFQKWSPYHNSNSYT